MMISMKLRQLLCIATLSSLSVAAEWKVFDVSVENISLVTNYRSTFASELDRSGVDGLLRVLREKNQAAVARTQPASS